MFSERFVPPEARIGTIKNILEDRPKAPRTPLASGLSESAKRVLYGSLLAGGVAMTSPEALASTAEHKPETQLQTMMDALDQSDRQAIDEKVREEIGEKYDWYLEVLQTFPLEAYLDSMAELTGMSRDELLKANALKEIIPVTLFTMGKAETEMKKYDIGTPSDRVSAQQLMGEIRNRSYVGLTVEDALIVFDLQHLSNETERIADEKHLSSFQKKALFQSFLRKTLVHELTHTFDSKERGEINPVEKDLREGITESMARRIVSACAPIAQMEAKGLFYEHSRYATDGQLAAARVLEIELGSEEVYGEYIRSGSASFKPSYDAKFGIGSWERFLQRSEFGTVAEVGVFNNLALRGIAPLYGLLR
jgi:hypothetical protein